jgi:hypothetical protein
MSNKLMDKFSGDTNYEITRGSLGYEFTEMSIARFRLINSKVLKILWIEGLSLNFCKRSREALNAIVFYVFGL